MSTYVDWGAYGQQGLERQQREEAQAKQAQEQREKAAAWQSRVPAWLDGIAQMDGLLEPARAQYTAAHAEADRAWAELQRACFVRQGGECHRSAEGLPIMDVNHPEVGGPKAGWDAAAAAEERAVRRVRKLEAEREYYGTLIAQARSMG